jgi:hypothetical protein
MDDAFACEYMDHDAALLTLGKDHNVLVWSSPKVSSSVDNNHDAWSDDDDESVDAYGRLLVAADPNSRHSGVRGLGYRSLRSVSRRP